MTVIIMTMESLSDGLMKITVVMTMRQIMMNTSAEAKVSESLQKNIRMN